MRAALRRAARARRAVRPVARELRARERRRRASALFGACCEQGVIVRPVAATACRSGCGSPIGCRRRTRASSRHSTRALARRLAADVRSRSSSSSASADRRLVRAGAASAAGAVGEVVGVGRRARNLDAALDARIVDHAITLDGPGARSFATPTSCWSRRRSRSSPSCSRRWPMRSARDRGDRRRQHQAGRGRRRARALGERFPRSFRATRSPAPSTRGAGAAFASLFDDRNVILTPLAEPTADARACVSDVGGVRRAGHRARPGHARSRASPRCRICRTCSRSRSSRSSRRGRRGELFAHAGSGFRDFTRIAAASPEMWRDICARQSRRAARRARGVSRRAGRRRALDRAPTARCARGAVPSRRARARGRMRRGIRRRGRRRPGDNR